ncbi:hypothetical protein K466DRAFT_507108, partial [Polyporus arcularius HHB13444]
LGENKGLPKADQWRRWVNIQVTVLWAVWRDEEDKIRTEAPEVPHNAKMKPTFTRNLLKIYQLFQYASLAERILAAKSISMEEVQHGHRYLRWCCEEMVRLGIHMVPNFHFAMHYPQFFELFGPVYAWWLFAHERFNGELEQVNLNGHADGEMELTLMRNWIAKQCIFGMLVSLPPNATAEERELLERVRIQKGAPRGTLRTQIAAFAQGTSTVITPKRVKKPTNLRKLPHSTLYGLLLEYTRAAFPELDIGNDMSCSPHDAILVADRSAKLLPFICKDGLRFGSAADSRTQADSYACVDFPEGRLPCHILYHFELQIKGKAPFLVSIVQRMTADDDIPVFPWSLRSTDLGIYVAYAQRYREMEVIATARLSATVAIVPIISHRLGPAKPLWVVHSFDRVRTYIEYTDYTAL